MKKEKYIRELTNQKGETFFRIFIPYRDEYGVQQKPVSANVKVKDFSSKKTALEFAKMERDKLYRQVHTNTYRNEYPTVEELFKKKYDYIVCSVATKKRQQAYWNGGMDKLASITIDKLTLAMLQKNINEYAYNQSDISIHHYISMWRDIYRVANIMDIPISDKTTSVIIPKSKKVQEPKPVDVTDSDFISLLKAIEESADINNCYFCYIVETMLRIAYYTGMRPAEILALSKEDIQDGYITVRRSLGSNEKEERAIIPTKTQNSIRKIPIHSELKPILDELIRISSFDPLLCNEDGSLPNIRRISTFINRTCKRIGINFRTYNLRHRFATNLIKNGASPRTTQELLGHASFSMSLYYARSTEEEKESAIESINEQK